MSYFIAALLGLVQGIAEFIPISSSGHLKIFETFFEMNQLGNLLFFDLCCHVGTLLALLVILQKDLVYILKKDWKKAFLIFFALVPLVPIYFFLKKPIESIFIANQFLPLFFLLSGLMLFVAQKQTNVIEEQKPKHAFVIGLFQSMALLPGISRLGSTLFAGKMMGLETKKAAHFSFLLAIPTILGGMLLETIKVFKDPSVLPDISLSCYLIGFSFSFMVGVIVLKWFLRYVEKGSLKPFSYYLFAVGSLMILTRLFHG